MAGVAVEGGITKFKAAKVPWEAEAEALMSWSDVPLGGADLVRGRDTLHGCRGSDDHVQAPFKVLYSKLSEA